VPALSLGARYPPRTAVEATGVPMTSLDCLNDCDDSGDDDDENPWRMPMRGTREAQLTWDSSLLPSNALTFSETTCHQSVTK
jgi:hypothetical protein